MTFEQVLSSLRPTGIIHLKPLLTIDLKKWLYTGDKLDITDRLWRHSSHPYEMSPSNDAIYEHDAYFKTICWLNNII